MNTLQELFENSFKAAFSEEKVLLRILKKKFKEQGFVLSEKQIKDLENKIINKEDLSTYKFDENEALTTPDDWKKFQDNGISIAIDSEKDLDEICEEISESLTNSLPEIADEVSDIIFETLKRNFKQYQKDFRRDIKQFNKNLEQEWGKAIDLLEMFYYISLETGSNFNEYYRPIAVKDKNLVFDVITRLHARSCQICSEIICLLKNGFADGAHARWRTLHEVAVITIFVQNHGNEVAERYILHSGIEDYKAARKYQECCETLGYQKLSDTEYSEIRDGYDQLIHKFGKNYKNEYGWASTALGKDSPTFADIEANANLDHMRPYYKMASHNVHANPKGVFFKLGLLPERSEILLSGPSNVGLTDPGHGTAISLLQVTSALLTLESNLDRLVICKILLNLENQIGEAFLEAQLAIEEADRT